VFRKTHEVWENKFPKNNQTRIYEGRLKSSRPGMGHINQRTDYEKVLFKMDAEYIFQGCFYRSEKNTIKFLCGFVTTDETQVHHNTPPRKKKKKQQKKNGSHDGSMIATTIDGKALLWDVKETLLINDPSKVK
jgi:hypothetical protein